LVFEADDVSAAAVVDDGFEIMDQLKKAKGKGTTGLFCPNTREEYAAHTAKTSQHPAAGK
jgi:hypothetical protein